MTRRGLFLAPFDALSDPVRVADLAVAAEAAGWDGVFVWDHVGYRAPVRRIADPWVCCAAIAGATSRVLLGPMVTPLARRRPHVVARQAASLAEFSRGRFVLGVGLGDDVLGEFSDFGDEPDPRVRAQMLDESLAVVQALLAGDDVDHDGPFYRVRSGDVGPTYPVPIWVAGRFPNRPPARRAARYHGYFVIDVRDPAELDVVRDQLGADAVTRDVVVDLQPGVDPAPWAAAGADWVLTRIGPYDLDDAAVRAAFALAEAGPGL